MKLSIIIPAYNEEKNIGHCLDELRHVLCDVHDIDHEIIVVNDCSSDGTEAVTRTQMEHDSNLRLISRSAPNGFGRAIRSGLQTVTGDIVVLDRRGITVIGSALRTSRDDLVVDWVTEVLQDEGYRLDETDPLTWDGQLVEIFHKPR